MMDLDDFLAFPRVDTQNMLGEIENLPAQLEKAWQIGLAADLDAETPVSSVVICGMGGSGIGAALLEAYVMPGCRVPVLVHRDYGLPAWARGAHTLVIASSHSGNTEETLDAFETGRRHGCRLLAVCTGGELEQRALACGAPVWKFEHHGQPRAAVGYSFGLLLAAFARLNLLAEPLEKTAQALAGAIRALRTQAATLRADLPCAHNPAKQQATCLIGRWVNVYGADYLGAVARRWKGQINELAKAGAAFEILPEADHNTLAGIERPEVLQQTMTLFLRAPSNHPRNRLRLELTRRVMQEAGLATDLYEAQGDTPLAHIWTALQFGDYLAYYLALAYGVDPTPIAALVEFKAAMKAGGHGFSPS